MTEDNYDWIDNLGLSWSDLRNHLISAYDENKRLINKIDVVKKYLVGLEDTGNFVDRQKIIKILEDE